jgi:hypothetical protein
MPGPPTQRFLAGARVDVIYPFAPVAMGTPLSMALMSYGDTYGIGIDSDPAAIPDPERLSGYLTTAIEELEARAMPRPVRRAARAAMGTARRSRTGKGLNAASQRSRSARRNRRRGRSPKDHS